MQSDKFNPSLIFDSKGLRPKFAFILKKFEKINQFLIPYKSSENHRFSENSRLSDDFTAIEVNYFAQIC